MSLKTPGTPNARGHNFEPQSYGLTPTQCFICNEFLNGFWQQGYQCQNCSINVHDHCRLQASETCFVTHRFKETSYLSIATCAACGQAMLGLWKQGYKCEDCGLDVHPQCRTQSSISNCRAVPSDQPVVGIIQLPSSTIKEEKEDAEQRSSFRDRRQSSSRGLHKSTDGSEVFEPLPNDIEGVRKEMKKLHEESIESSRKLEEQWEKVTKPALKAQRAQLQQQYDHLKLKQKEKQAEVATLAQKRDDALKAFLKNFYQKYNPSKVKNVDQVIRHYANGSCRERDLFAELLEKYANEPTAVALVEHERSYGLLAKGELEQALVELEEVSSQVSKSKSALATLRRDVYFSPNVPWLVKGGAEGIYAGFTSAWLEQCIGLFRLNLSVSKGEHTSPLPPGDDGYRPRLSLQLTGSDGNPGFQFSARMEDMCLQGSALPIALSLRDADYSVQFDLSVEVQYDPPSSTDDPTTGSWRVLDNGFKLKTHKFQLKTRNTGTLAIPDMVMGTMVQTVITFAFKKALTILMPPELGVFMMAVHQHRVSRRNAGHMDGSANEAKSGLEWAFDQDANVWRSRSWDGSAGDSLEERFLKIEAKLDIKQTIELDAVDAVLADKNLDSPTTQRILNNLQMDKEQFKLLLQAQKDLGLTYGGVWGSVSADWLSTIATTVTGSGPDLGRLPLQSLMDLVKYHRDFLDPLNLSNGMSKSRKAYVARRFVDLWQHVCDLVCSQNGGEMDGGGIAGRMRRMVTQRLTKQADIRAFEFEAFVKRLGDLSKKELHSEVEVSIFEICMPVRGLVRTLRDIALRIIGKNKMQLNARSAVVRKKTSLGNAFSSSSGDTVSTAENVAQAIAQDKSESKMNGSLLPDLGKTLPMKIQRASDFVLEKLRDLQERYVDSIRLRIELVAGEGNYRAAANDIRLVAPVDVGLQLSPALVSAVLSHKVKHASEVDAANKWMWNRKVTIEDGQFKIGFTRDNKAPQQEAKGGMVEALRRLGGRAAQAAVQDLGSFEISASGFFAQMRTESAAVTDVVSLSLRPLSDPDRIEVKALGAGTMRLHASVDRVDGHGQFATLFHYVDDFLAAVAKDQPDLQRLRVFPKFVAGFAARDSFYIDTLAWISVKSELSAGDLVVSAANHAGRRCVRVVLTHFLNDVIHDLLDLFMAATKLSPRERA